MPVAALSANEAGDESTWYHHTLPEAVSFWHLRYQDKFSITGYCSNQTSGGESEVKTTALSQFDQHHLFLSLYHFNKTDDALICLQHPLAQALRNLNEKLYCKYCLGTRKQ